MKIKNILYALSIMFIVSCGNDYVIDEHFDLEELPGYVAFDADGNQATLADVSVMEDAGIVNVGVENPTGSSSDITVNYSLSGSAIYGVDYSIDGASASGGSVVIDHDRFDFENLDSTNIKVNILTDDTFDETKEIIITLTDASNAEGNVEVGRGGTDLLTVAKIVIANIDCEFIDISTDYTFESSNFSMPNGSCDGTQSTSGNGTMTMVTESTFTFDDWSFGSYPECYGGLPGDWGTLTLNFCSNIVSITGADTYGDAWTWTSVSASGPELSISWTNAFGEDGSTVLTKADGSDWNPLTL